MKSSALTLVLVLCFLTLTACTPESGSVTFTLSLPLSGAFSEQGQGILAGAELAAERINEAGGIRGKELRLEIQDSCGRSAESEKHARTAADGQPLCFIGGFPASDGLTAAVVCQEAKLPFLSLSGPLRSLPEGSIYTFSMEPGPDAAAGFLCRSLEGAESAAVLYSNDVDGAEQCQAFLDAAEKRGLDVFAEPVNAADYNFGFIIEKLRQTNVDHIVLFTDSAAILDFLQHLQEECWEVPVYFTSLEKAFEITVDSLNADLYAVDDRGLEDFSGTNEDSLPAWGLKGYDAVWFLAECARSVDGRLTRKALRNAIASQTECSGRTGPLACDETGAAVRDYQLFHYADQEWTLVESTV